MNNCGNEWMPYANVMGISNQMYPMMEMPEQQLNAMYPRTYHMIYPQIVRACDTMDMNHGPMHMPNHDEVENMVEDVVGKVENDIDVVLKENENQRQLGYGGRRLLRDLTGILLIRELIRRRRRPQYPYGYGPGYGPGYGLGPGYGGIFY